MEMKEPIATEFHKLIRKEILPSIARAVGSLQADIVFVENKLAEKIFIEEIGEMKNIVTCYMDEQMTIFKKLRENV